MAQLRLNRNRWPVRRSAFASHSSQRTVLDEPPTAALGASPAVPIPGQSVTFNAGGSGDSDGAIASYAWDFGDGNTGTGQTPSHAYAAPGTYTVTLTERAAYIARIRDLVELGSEHDDLVL